MIVRTIGYGLFSSLRVLALSQRNWYLAIPVFLLCLPSAIMPTYVYAHQESPAVDRYGCQLAYIASPTVHDRLRIAGIIADLLSETIVIVVTVSRTFGLRKFKANDVSFGGKQRPGIASLLLRDGTIYFIALLVLSLADMLVLIFDHVPEFATRYDYWVVPYYTPVFRTIIICRFLLMLRAVYYDDDHGDDEEGPDQPIHFASRIIGPLGAPVDASLFDEEASEDEEFVYAGDPLTSIDTEGVQKLILSTSSALSQLWRSLRRTGDHPPLWRRLQTALISKARMESKNYSTCVTVPERCDPKILPLLIHIIQESDE
ncbi:hypothetical protein K438DRAFT_2017806 [Mycena galopus ATCC 62051]|nr:hypothetical protein K438DRAFT_2017806 [Mycena galopus ATCC 62051]